MEDNQEKKPQFPNKSEASKPAKFLNPEASKTKNPKEINDKPAGERDAVSRDRAVAEERARQEQAEMIKRIALRGKEEENKGLLDIFLEFIKGLFGGALSEEKLNEVIDKSEAMRGLRAYWAIKPENTWKAMDFARVLCMLELDSSWEAQFVHTSIKAKAKEKGMENDVSNKGKKIIDAHPEFSVRSGSEREDVVHRAIQINADLWGDMVEAGEGDDLSSEVFEVFERGIDSLRPRGEHVVQDGKMKVDLLTNSKEAKRIKRLQEGKLYTRSGSEEIDKERKGEQDRGGNEKKGASKEKGRQGSLKKGREAFGKDFSSEDQLRIKAWVESGDPKSFEKAIKIFEKYEGDPRTLKKAAESYLRDYEFNVEHGMKPSENAEKFADLMKDVLYELRVSGGSGPNNARDEIEVESVQDTKQKSDQGKGVERNEAKGGDRRDRVVEPEKEEVKKKEKKNEPEFMRKSTAEEILEAVRENNKYTKNLPDILETTQAMLKELEDLNKKMDHLIGINGTYMTMYMRDPLTFKKNYDRYKNEYATIRNKHLELDNKINKLSGAEKRVLGRERDQELYTGTIGQALNERMERIEFLVKYRQNSKDPDTDPDQAGISEEQKNFRRKMQKVYKDFENEGVLAKKEGLYFKELQRWVGVIITNVDEGRLKMPADIYNEFKRIKGVPSDVYNYLDLENKVDKNKFEEGILDVVGILKGEKEWKKGEYLKFLDYFTPDDPEVDNSYLNLTGKGFSSKGAIGQESYGYPNSLEASMLLMAEDRGPEWQTGGKYELVDAEGKFHRKNFMLWMDKMFNIQTDWDPNVKIDFQRGTQFKAGFSYVTLFDILFLPQYTRHQEYEIRGDTNGWYSKTGVEKGEAREQESVIKPIPTGEQGGGQGEKANVERGWGEAKEHPEMSSDVRIDKMLVNAWKLGTEHNDWVDLNDNKVRWNMEAWVAKNGEIANLNNYTRAGLAFQSVMLPSHRGNEAENYFKEDKQGSYGRAVNAGILAHRYLAEFTKYYTEKENGKTIEVNKKDNMFYQALGNDGASIFLKTLAEGAFDQVDETEFDPGVPGARTKIKEAYKKFILGLADKMKDEYKESLKGEDGKNLELLVKNFKDDLNGLKGAKLDGLKIGLDRFDKLTKLKLDIESKVGNMGIVDEEEKGSYDLKKVVVREEKEREISKLMRENIGKFFDDVKSIEMPYVPEKKSGEKEKVDRNRKVKIEELMVYTDANGRIVTEEEWEQMPANRRGEKRVGEIMDEFGESFVDYGDKLEKFGKAVREYERAIGEGESTVEAEKQINGLDPKCGEILKLYEALGLAMVTKVANISRNELNRFNTTRPRGGTSTGDIPIMKNAFRKSLASIYGLNEIEEESVYNRVFYPLSRLDIASFNNTSGVPGGIEQGSWFSRFMEARNARMDMQEFAGSTGTLTQLVALRLPTALERWRVRYPGEGKPEHMLIEVLQGAEGREMAKRWKRRLKDNPTLHYEMAGNEEQADFGDGLACAEALRNQVVSDKELQFNDIVHMDQWGVERVDHENAIKIFDAWWNKTRLTFNSHGIDFDAKIAVDGRGTTVMEHLFGKDIQKTHERMMKYYKEHSDKLEGEGKLEDAKAYRELLEELKTKPAMAAFLDMVTMSIHEHREFGGTYNQWSAHTIGQIWWAMNHFLHKKSGIEWHGNEAKTGEKPSMVPYELFNRLRGVHEDSPEKDTFWDFFYAFVAGFLEGTAGTWAEFKDEIALIQKTPPLSA